MNNYTKDNMVDNLIDSTTDSATNNATDNTINNIKFKHTDISSIIKMISPLGINDLSNNDLNYWYENLNNGNKGLSDLINRIKKNNLIELNSFLKNPGNFELNKTFMLNVIIDNNKFIDPNDKSYSIYFFNSTNLLDNCLTNDSLSEVKGQFKKKDDSYYFLVTEFKLLMTDWRTFNF